MNPPGFFNIYVINLIQDVNVLRPLIYLSAKGLGHLTEIIVTPEFVKRDSDSLWASEIYKIAADCGAMLYFSEDDANSYLLVSRKRGVLVAASESNLSAHAPTHNLMRSAPPGLLTVTLQHGYECVGFLQSEQHDIAHGQYVTFAADVVCGWFDESRMASMQPSQKPKLQVTGSTALLQKPAPSMPMTSGIVCENLHSTRLNVSGDLKASFISVFSEFTNRLESRGETVTLRPHPGGQYVVKNAVDLSSAVVLANGPIYELDLSAFTYGISAPSSVLIDMMLAGIPVAVWRDDHDIMDADNYSGLCEIKSVDDWEEFSKDAVLNPEKYLALQEQFLESRGFQRDPLLALDRFRSVLSPQYQELCPKRREGPKRILFVANSILPTLQLSFIKPLAPMVESGQIETSFITEADLRYRFSYGIRGPRGFEICSRAPASAYLADRMTEIDPDYIVFCRYSGPQAPFIRRWAGQQNIPVIFHLDDDLLNIPPELGHYKFHHHNEDQRVKTVRYLLDNVDLVYASTERLKERFGELGTKAGIVNGEIYCSGEVIEPVENRPVRKIGYMGQSDHAHNLAIVLPALVEVLRNNEDIVFELFGSIPVPEELEEFGERVVTCPPVTNYENFLVEFSLRRWDIGICPLDRTRFNLLKANTKWVEYTMCGIAVVATKDTVYDRVGSDGCAALVSENHEWVDALQHLIVDPQARYEQVKAAQARLTSYYSIDKLRAQVLSILDQADELVAKRADR